MINIQKKTEVNKKLIQVGTNVKLSNNAVSLNVYLKMKRPFIYIKESMLIIMNKSDIYSNIRMMS